jgi:hypothetical protein
VYTHTKFSTTSTTVDLVLYYLGTASWKVMVMRHGVCTVYTVYTVYSVYSGYYENYYYRVGQDGTGASHPRGGRARDFTLPGSGSGTLPGLQVGGIIENQNSDFAMA